MYMRRIVKLTVCLLLLFLLFQFIVLLFTKDHDVTYQVTVGKESYTIHEIFRNNTYNLEVLSPKKERFHFQFDYAFNKQSKIIKTLKVHKEENVMCLVPSLLKDKKSYGRCLEGNEEYSFQVLKEKNQGLYEVMKEVFKLPQEVINLPRQEGDISYYRDNIEDGTSFAVWAYNHLFYASKEKIETLPLFQKDQYENDYSIRVGKYYLTANSNEKHDFTMFYLIDLETGKKDTWQLTEKISFDSYFLGVVGEEAYLFDRENLLEYRLNPAKKEIEVIGNKEQKGQYYDSKWQERNIYDFKKEDIHFPVTKENEKLRIHFTPAAFYENKEAYYFEDHQNLYVAYRGFEESPVLLLTKKELKEMEVVDGIVYFIDGDTLYSYHSQKGLRPILERREFTFNFKNIYTVYQK